MAGYTRQSAIIDGNTGFAALWNDEYDQLVTAFGNTTGHKHDGTAAEGPVIGLIGDAGVVTPLNKLTVDTVNNRISFYADVSSAAVEQVRVEDGVIKPVTDNDIDLGTVTLQFKNGYFDGLVDTDSLLIGTGITVTTILDEDSMATDSATALSSQQSIKAYVDAQVAGGTTALSVVLGVGNSTGGTDIVVTAGDEVTTDTISETTSAAGVTIDSVLLKDGLVDARDVATDGTKLDGIEAAATADQTDAEIRTAVEAATDSNVFTDADHSKLDAIEALADVTDTANVTTAGALMDSEVDADLKTFILPASTTISTFGATVVDDTSAGAVRTTIGAIADISEDTTPTLGGALDGADNTVSKVNLKDYGEITNAIGAIGGGTQDIDLELGNSVVATVDTSTTTFTFSNPTASDEMCGFVLTLTNGGSQTVNWPVTVDWPGGIAPTLTTAGVDILVFFTVDGGTTWHGMVASTDSK